MENRKYKLLMKGLFLLLITLSGIPFLVVMLTRYYNYDSLETRAVRLEYDSDSSLFYYYNEPNPSPLPWNHGSLSDNLEVPSSAKKSETKKIEKLHWTSVHGRNATEAYHFVSAYLDDRTDAKYRPAVVVVGYFSRTAKPTDLYCMIKFSSGRSGCLRQKAVQEKSNCDSVIDRRKSKPMLYICRLNRLRSSLPISVRISNVSSCDATFSSAELPVGNLEHKKNKFLPKKKFGVFLGGPLVLKENLIENLTKFIRMSQLLGADLFTIYVHPELTGQDAIDFLQKTYPKTVRLIEWKNFEVHRPLHYYGQLVLITDCLYRSMYEVEYLVMMDLDEVILPVNQNSWAELVKDLEKHGRFAAYSFLNRFFAPPSHFDIANDLNSTMGFDPETVFYGAPESKVAGYFGNTEVPAYFSRTQEVECYFNHGAKTKLFMNPRRLVRATVHQACESVRYYRPVYRVPADVAISAHYRESTIPDCVSKPTIENNIAIKFAKQFAERYSKVT